MNNFDISLEGNTLLDPDEKEGLLHKHVTNRSQLDVLEQSNIQEGMQWLERQKSIDPFTITFVCLLHKKLFGQVWGWAGKFRLTAKNIGCDAKVIGSEMRKLLDDAHYWVENNTYKPKELAARFHHRLVKIHPFPNGNGRHARIMTDVILTKILHVEPINWSGGHDLKAIRSARREQYILALREADRDNYQPLISFVNA